MFALERELDQQRKERLCIEERIAAIETERRAYLERYLDVEAQNANVSNLYVAMLRLHHSVDHSDVLMAIQEIVINLIGSEELAIFELSSDGSHYALSSSFGIEAGRIGDVDIGAGVIGACALSGRTYIASEEPPAPKAIDIENDLTACVPLVVDGAAVGAVAIFRLLKHKPKLEPIDRELFALLSSHAAMALYCTSLVASSGGRESLHARVSVHAPRR